MGLYRSEFTLADSIQDEQGERNRWMSL